MDFITRISELEKQVEYLTNRLNTLERRLDSHIDGGFRRRVDEIDERYNNALRSMTPPLQK